MFQYKNLFLSRWFVQHNHILSFQGAAQLVGSGSFSLYLPKENSSILIPFSLSKVSQNFIIANKLTYGKVTKRNVYCYSLSHFASSQFPFLFCKEKHRLNFSSTLFHEAILKACLDANYNLMLFSLGSRDQRYRRSLSTYKRYLNLKQDAKNLRREDMVFD